MHRPVKAVADTSGWKDEATLIACHQQPPDKMKLEVMECASCCEGPSPLSTASAPVAVDDAVRTIVDSAPETAHKLHQAL